MSVANVARIFAVLAACIAAAGSATSRSRSSENEAVASQGGPGGQNGPPPPQQMDASRALGLWQSTFGAVKIEADNSQGGIAAGNLQGIWVYPRQGQEVIGYFSGNLRGNVLQFRWQEPNDPPLTGEGYLVFDVDGRQYSGRWWSDKRDRVGDWNGWRQQGAQRARTDPSDQEDGDAYGQAPPQPSPYRRPQPYQQPYRPYPPQPPQPYQQPYPPQPPQPYQQPYPPQPYQQPYPPQPYQQPYPPQPNQPYQQPYPRGQAPQPQPRQPSQPVYY